jgi:hypothetical protein
MEVTRMASKKAIADCFDVLNFTYPQAYARFDGETIAKMLSLWEQDFSHVGDAELEKAVCEARRKCKFFPSVAEMLEYCGEDFLAQFDFTWGDGKK